MNSDPSQGQLKFVRDRMVKDQIIKRGVRDCLVLMAMQQVPRHEFIPASLIESAYSDCPLKIGEGQTISQPYIVGLMTEMLAIKPEDRVFEVGTGSGYQTAILAELAATVFTSEIREKLSRGARSKLARIGYKNINFRVSDGSVGWAEVSPFDCIIVTAGACSVPEKLLEQLGPGGRMVIPVGKPEGVQTLKFIRKSDDEAIDIRDTVPVRFVPMFSSKGGPSRSNGP